MPIIEFYKFNIEKKKELPDLIEMMDTAEGTPPTHYDSPLDCFASFFKTGGHIPFSLLTTDEEGNSVYEPYGNDVLRHEEGVILMTLENNKVKHTTNDKKDNVHPHHPFCNIIIDNRPEHCYIAIERNSAFNGDPNKVAYMMIEAFNNRNFLGQYHYEFTMEKMKKKKADFWAMVTDIRKLFNDVVRQIRFDFNGKKGNAPDPDGLVALLSQLSQKAECATSLLLNSEDEDKGVRFEEIYDDLTHLADICMTHHGYDLSVRFKRFGIFRYGADVLAQFGIDDELLTDFEQQSQPEIKNLFDDSDANVTLLTWLNRMHSILKDYEHEPLVSTKRTIRRRRRIR